MTMNAAIYARVSTKDQSCELQLSDLRKMAAARGFEIAEEYVDWGVSGAKEQRPELSRLMGDAKRGRFNIVLVWRFDRFARSLKHLVSALEEFQALGVSFISHQEAIDTSTPMGRMVFAITGAFAEMERELIRERVSAGLRRAKATGKRLGRPKVDVDIESILELTRQVVRSSSPPRQERLSNPSIPSISNGFHVTSTALYFF